MTAVVVVLLVAGWVSTVAVLGSLMRSGQRAHARREDLLVNQILHLSGRTWLPSPADEHAVEESRERASAARDERRRAAWVSPEQLPVE